jgi:pimeloyl-ACP methyl ester carboxylesterase
MKLLLKLLLGLIVIVGLSLGVGYFVFKKEDIPYADLEARYANPLSKFIDLPSGVRLHFRDQGNPQRPALLLIHGFGSSLETWEPWVQQLQEDYRLLSLDLPNHGLTRIPPGYRLDQTSFADVCAEFAALLGVEKYTAIGNSMGGHTAWQLALRHPDRLQALVLIAAGGWSDPNRSEKPPLVFRILGNGYVAPLLADLDPKMLVRNGLEGAFADKSMVTNRMIDRYTDLALAPGRRQLIVSRPRNANPDARATQEKLAAIKVPTLIMWGDKDIVVPVTGAQKFKDAIPGSSMIIYQGLGHVPYEEAAENTARDLKAFLDRELSDSGSGSGIGADIGPGS